MTKMLSDMSDVKSQRNVPNNVSGTTTRNTGSGGKKSPAEQKVLKTCSGTSRTISFLLSL